MKHKVNLVLMIITVIALYATLPLMGSIYNKNGDDLIRIEQIERYNIDPAVTHIDPTAKVKIKLNTEGDIMEYKWIDGNPSLKNNAKELVYEYLVFTPIDEYKMPKDSYYILPLRF